MTENERPQADSHPKHAPGHTNRRSFLKSGGLIAAGVAVAAAGATGVAVGRYSGAIGSTYIPEEFAIPTPRKNPGFDHLVVVMGENRSFDNMLGYLYTPDAPPPRGKFEGLAFGNYSNAASDGTLVKAHTYRGATDSIMGKPNPDPGEEYPHVNAQLFGYVDAENHAKDVGEMVAPFNLPDPLPKATMSGFVLDYEGEFTHLKGHAPKPAKRDQIMGSFAPEMLPVVSMLAREFGVFDRWFCAVPSQTFCNRSFFHANTSHGFVINKHNGSYAKWLKAAPAPTVFNRLEEAGRSWRIYFDKLQLISFTGVIHAPVLEQYWGTDHFATMEQFHEDTKNGTLPDYAFIEPRMIYNHNDFHPPVGLARESDLGTDDEVWSGGVSDARAGDALIHELYTAVRGGMAKSGSNYLNTALLITFDEHGGTYDHVAPPKATPPDDSGPGEMGFAFDRLGCRVPAILVSAHVERGSVFQHEMHHGSLAATLSERFGLRPLTRRDDTATSLDSAFNRKVPRHVADWPQTSPSFVPPNPEASEHPAKSHPNRPLSPPAKGLIGLIVEKYGTADEKAHPPETFKAAYDMLVKYGTGLFGVPAT
ncbi:phospholipase C [Leucobacter exalbidus]|uniref:phospholipase C n=1 Tax=Leucobacter exalbidus TaxID=662960 RepID=A0A940T551_9MICO|nr:alkaline phosphatase family protein [Leucobacter exalbidus]MBP1325636.1 phospholipase C [Leucobacter exalbidus]